MPRENAAIEYCGAQYQHDRLPALAADLVGRQVNVIIAISTSGSARGQGSDQLCSDCILHGR